VSTATNPKSLESYKEAAYEALEPYIELAAKIEQAADLVPGSFLGGMAAFIESGANEVIGYIEDGYELKEVPPDWHERVEAIIKEWQRS